MPHAQRAIGYPAFTRAAGGAGAAQSGQRTGSFPAEDAPRVKRFDRRARPGIAFARAPMNLHAARYVDRWAGPPVHLALHAAGRATGRRLAPLGATTPPAAGRTWARPRRVLAIKFYGLGNLVMILPTLAALRAAVPEVEIDFLTLPGNEALLERSGLVTRVLTVEVATFPRFVRAGVRLTRRLRAGGYDAVLDFEQFLKVSGIFGFLSGAPELIGFDTEGQHRGWLYTTRVVSTDSVHTRELFLRLAIPLGLSP